MIIVRFGVAWYYRAPEFNVRDRIIGNAVNLGKHGALPDVPLYYIVAFQGGGTDDFGKMQGILIYVQSRNDYPAAMTPRRIIAFIDKARSDGITGLASMLAYNFFLVIPVVGIMVVAILGELPFLDLSANIFNQLEGVVPDEALDLIIEIVDDALTGGSGILVFSVFATLYVLSNAYAGIIGSLNIIYHVEETRPWLIVRFRALIMSFVAAGFLLASFAMVVVAPLVADYLSDSAGASQTAAIWIDRMRWPAIIILAVIGIESSYKFGPNGGPRWRIISPGALLATGAWVVATVIFGFYVNNFTSYDRLYGTLGTVVALLILLWLSSLIFLIGAEVNSFWSKSSRIRKMRPEQIRTGHPDV